MLLFLLASAAVATQPPAPRPIDRANWLSAEDFPFEAEQKGWEGPVGYRLDVDPAGNVAACLVTSSSGHKVLDDATCTMLTARAHFAPATDATGHKVASSYARTVQWKLPPAPPLSITVSRAGWRAPAGARFPQPPTIEPTPPAVVDPAAISPPADPRVRFGRLDNGLRYAILANNSPYGAVSFRLRFGVGSIDETAAQAGYAHLIEHMMFRGSTNVPDGEFVRSLEQMGLTLGSDTTAFTDPEGTVFGLDFPLSQLSNATTGLFLLREVASRATITPAPLSAERGVVLSERRLRDTAAQRMENARLAFLLPGQAVVRPTIGTLASVTDADADGLRAFYREHYRPDRSVLVVVGNVVPADVEADIKLRFRDWPAPSPPPHVAMQGPVRSRGPAVRLFVEPGAPKQVRIDWQSPFDPAPDTYAREGRSVAEWIATEILNDRFVRLADRPGAPFSAAAVGQEQLFHAARETSLAIEPLDGKLRPAIAAALVEQRRLLRFGISRTELDRALNQLHANVATVAAAADTRASADLANGLVASFDGGRIFVTPRQYAADVDRLVGKIAIADVNAAAARLFAGSGPLLFVSANTPSEGGEAALRATLVSASAMPIGKDVSATATAWAYTDFGAPGRIVERKEVADFNVTVVRFANGTTATIRPAAGTGEVLLNLAFGSGVAGLPIGLERAYWLVNQAPQAFIVGGLGKAGMSDLNDQLKGKVVGVALQTGNDRFNLVGHTRPDDLEAEAQLLTAYVVDPAFRPRALRDAVSAEQSARAQVDASVPLTAANDLDFLLHDRDPRWRGVPTSDDLQRTTITDLAALLRPALAGPLNLVIVGDIDVDRAVRVAQRTVGALPPRGPRPARRSARFPLAPPDPLVETVPTPADQGMAVAAWPTAAFWTSTADSRALQVLADVMKARLIAGLRARDGLTYSPDVSVDQAASDPGYASIFVQVELPPAKTPAFYAEIDSIARDLAKNPIGAEELGRARTPMIDAARRGYAYAGFWLDALADTDDDSRNFDVIRSRIPELERVSAADIQRLAARYLLGRPPFRFSVRSGGVSANSKPATTAASGAAHPRAAVPTVRSRARR